MNYRKEQDGMIIDGKWSFWTYKIVEENTKLVIKESLKKNEATYLLNRLNQGGGFNGYTPAFLLEQFKVA